MLKNKFKSCFQLQENIWNTRKVLKFKKVKWKFLKNKLAKKNSGTPLIFFFKQRTELNKLYKNTLNFKRKLLCFCGPLKLRFLSNLMKKRIRYIDLKIKEGNFNNLYSNSLKYNKLNYIMNNFESLLCVVLSRSNAFTSIYQIIKLIKTGKVCVNNKIILNPKYTVRPDDVITFIGLNTTNNNLHISKNSLSSITELLDNNINIKNTLLNIKIETNNNNKSKLLLYNNLNDNFYNNDHIYTSFSKLNINYILYFKPPSILDLDYKTDMDWSLYNYLLKLKR